MSSELTKSEIKNISEIERELSVTILQPMVQQEIDKAYQRISSKVRLKGFRPGKAPRKVLEQHYRADAERDALDRVINTGYQTALKAHNLEPVSEPEVSFNGKWDTTKDFSFSAKIEIRPNVEIKNWEGIKVETNEYTITEKDLQNELKKLQKHHSTMTLISDRKVIEKGDIVEVSQSAKKGEEELAWLTDDKRVIEIGEGSTFEALEMSLLGKNLEESYEVEVKIPSDHFNPKIKGETLLFSVTAKSIKVRSAPDLDDEFAKDISDKFETIADLKKAIKENLNGQKNVREEEEIHAAVIKALKRDNPFTTPKGLIKRQAEHAAFQMIQHLPQDRQKKLWKEHGDRLVEQGLERAEEGIEGALILEALVKELDVGFEESEVEAEFEKEAARMKTSVSDLKARYKEDDKESMRRRVRNEKSIKMVIEKAAVTKKKKSFFDAVK